MEKAITRSNSNHGVSDRNNTSTVNGDSKHDSMILVTTARFKITNAAINQQWQQQQHVGNSKNRSDSKEEVVDGSIGRALPLITA